MQDLIATQFKLVSMQRLTAAPAEFSQNCAALAGALPVQLEACLFKCKPSLLLIELGQRPSSRSNSNQFDVNATGGELSLI